MPNSLKARLKKLKYQGVLSQEDIDRIVILPNAEKAIKNATTMTNEEAIKHLTAKLECLTRSKGFREKCDNYNSYEGCYECDLGYKQGNIGEQIESLKLAIKALKQEPKTDIRECKNCKHSKDGHMAGTEKCHECMWESKQEPCENCCNGNQIEKAKLCQKSYIAGMEHKQEPKTGHWIMTSDYLTTAYRSIDYVKCSCCGEDSLEEGDYCPNCGARMIGGVSR